MTAEEAAALIRPVDVVGMGLGPANPPALLTALSARDDWEDLTIGGALVLGLFDVFQHPGVNYRSGFFGPAERFYAAAGARVEHVPAGFRRFAPILARMAPRVMTATATPPGPDGTVSLSLHHGATAAELLAAGRDPERLLIIETNEALPRTGFLPEHPNTIPIELIDVLVAGRGAPFELPEAPATAADDAIAELAAGLVVDGATLQTGIGGIPTKVADRLAAGSGGGYGIHSEMLTDGIMRLHKAGKVTNANKGIFPGRSITTFALGSAELYTWLDGNEEVAFAPVGLVNDPMVISSNRSFVSINGAIAVDLYGQIVADSIDGRQVSGVGGHEDFVVGAELDTDDRSLVCLSSTVEVAGEVRSRILPVLPSGSVVSTPRHHTGTIVTEYGPADVTGMTVRERAEALAGIAHPDFRDELLAAAARLS
jgi:acyl-CoA hydrolase